MSKIRLFIFLALIASSAFCQRAYIPKVSPNETPALTDGEMAVGVESDGSPVQVRFGDGVTPGGRVLYDSRTALQISPVTELAERDYGVSVSSPAYWTNGVIEAFPPTAVFDSTLASTITLTLASADYKIQSVLPQAAVSHAGHASVISADGLSAEIIVTQQTPPPGPGATHYYTIDKFTVMAYANPAALGVTQDLRAAVTLVAHPGWVEGGSLTNESDYRPITLGWYASNVQSAVASYASHPALSTLALQDGLTWEDGINLHERFRWTQNPNGYLSLAHESDTTKPVMDVESMDPYPWIVSEAPSGSVSTLEYSTNGIVGDFRLQTSTNYVTGTWVDAVTLSTNSASAGYMSLTASNVLAGDVAFWRVAVSNGVQAAARVNFGVPVQVQGHAVLTNPAAFASAAQGILADTALQPPATNSYATTNYVISQMAALTNGQTIYKNITTATSNIVITATNSIYLVSLAVPTVITQAMGGLTLTGQSASWEVWVNYQSTNALTSLWQNGLIWDTELDLTVTGTYKFAMSTTDGLKIRATQTFPMVHPVMVCSSAAIGSGAGNHVYTTYGPLSNPMSAAGTNGYVHGLVPDASRSYLVKYGFAFSSAAAKAVLLTLSPKTHSYGFSDASLDYTVVEAAPASATAGYQTRWIFYPPLGYVRAHGGFGVDITRSTNEGTVYIRSVFIRRANELEIAAYAAGWRP